MGKHNGKARSSGLHVGSALLSKVRTLPLPRASSMVPSFRRGVWLQHPLSMQLLCQHAADVASVFIVPHFLGGQCSLGIKTSPVQLRACRTTGASAS